MNGNPLLTEEPGALSGDVRRPGSPSFYLERGRRHVPKGGEPLKE